MKELRERLAEYSHGAWSGWMKYMFSMGVHNKDGSWTMPSGCVERWTRQMNTPYDDLPNGEEKSDLAEADKIMEAIG